MLVDTTGLLLSAVGAVAGVVSAYFAYVAVRHQLSRRRRRPVPSVAPPEPVPSAEGVARYDVFVSYGREDADWVGAFAARLRETGLNVAYDEVVSRPGRSACTRSRPRSVRRHTGCSCSARLR